MSSFSKHMKPRAKSDVSIAIRTVLLRRACSNGDSLERLYQFKAVVILKGPRSSPFEVPDGP
jgi:hypothetical protein